MRQLILDTETTGLDPKDHRIIEIAAVELIDRRPTGRSVHFYINPDREIDLGASDVHGLSWEMLRDKPKFAEIAEEFVAFASGAQWIIHNAPFDVAFLDGELSRLGMSTSAAIAAEVDLLVRIDVEVDAAAGRPPIDQLDRGDLDDAMVLRVEAGGFGV